jgi:ubiquinone/menaquinone biosynthesis C-methylase UbiE
MTPEAERGSTEVQPMTDGTNAGTPARADYGLDAPSVVRNLLLVSAASLATYGSIAAGLWAGRVPLGGGVVLELPAMMLGVGLGCGFMAAYMAWTSKFGKVAEREKLLDLLALSGAERVLDVGCGRGLLLVGAARRLTTGSAVGVDIWQSEDLSGNRPEAALENARREGVLGRVRVETADMRTLPFPDEAFDVVVSRAAVHNLYARADRAKALGEMARVLAPGGTVLIDDIRHLPEYEAELRARQLTDFRLLGSRLAAAALAVLTWGSLRPGVLLARKHP